MVKAAGHQAYKAGHTAGEGTPADTFVSEAIMERQGCLPRLGEVLVRGMESGIIAFIFNLPQLLERLEVVGEVKIGQQSKSGYNPPASYGKPRAIFEPVSRQI